jgi:hypothetical protein
MIHFSCGSDYHRNYQYLMGRGIVNEESHPTLFTYSPLRKRIMAVQYDSPRRMKNKCILTAMHVIWDCDHHMKCSYLFRKRIVAVESNQTLTSY